jgi:hypothetical protein
VTNYVELVDQIIRAREKYGWSSDLVKSPEWKQAQSLWADAALEKKDVNGLGVLNGGDLAIIGKAMGTTDPTEIRDPIPGLRQSRETTLRSFNNSLRKEGLYTGVEDFDIPELTGAGLLQTADLGAAGAQVKDLTEASRSKARGIGLEGGFEPSVGGFRAKEGVYAVTPKERTEIDKLVENARAGDQPSRAALAALSRDRVLGAPVKLSIGRSGLDFADLLSKEELAAIDEAATWADVAGIRKGR